MSESEENGAVGGFISARSHEQLRISSSPRLIQVLSGPHVVPTRRGYQPVLCVEELHEGKKYLLYISAMSLTEALEEIRAQRAGSLVGAAIKVRKESEEKMARYEAELV
jgi:hypothetical protein